ncbi:EpsG family protein [Clostridium sp.]
MLTMYATLITTFIFSFLSRISSDKKYRILALFWVVIVSIILIAFSGFRTGAIGDTGMYMHSYRLYANDPSTLKLDRDGGFAILNLILIQFSSDPQILVFVTSMIVNLCNMIVFYRYGSYLELQVYLYIASGYLTVTMNGMRQCVAAAILFTFTIFIIKGKFKEYVVIVLIVSTIHASALIMIPVYFIVRQEAWSRNVVIMIVLACIGVVFYNVLSPILFKALENTQYGGYSEFNEGGSSFIRTVVNMVPVFLAYIKRDKLKEEWPESNIFVNMALINVIFVAFGMFNWIFNRFTLYMQLYNFILIPFIIRNCFKGKERRLLYLGVLLCYFVFFYREQVIGMNMSYPSVLKVEDLFY